MVVRRLVLISRVLATVVTHGLVRHAMVLHTSFIFIKFKKMKKNHDYSVFTQKLFNCIFKEIESNLRENGYGDATVNKNMKFLESHQIYQGMDG